MTASERWPLPPPRTHTPTAPASFRLREKGDHRTGGQAARETSPSQGVDGRRRLWTAVSLSTRGGAKDRGREGLYRCRTYTVHQHGGEGPPAWEDGCLPAHTPAIGYPALPSDRCNALGPGAGGKEEGDGRGFPRRHQGHRLLPRYPSRRARTTLLPSAQTVAIL